MLKHILLAVSMLLVLTACNWNPNNEYHAGSEDINGTKLMTAKDGSRKEGFYEIDRNDDDYTSINTNPNFVDLTEDRPDKGDLQDKLEYVIAHENNFEAKSIYMNGNDFYVNVRPEKKMSKKEMKKASKALHKRLIYAVPDYQIHVDVEE